MLRLRLSLMFAKSESVCTGRRGLRPVPNVAPLLAALDDIDQGHRGRSGHGNRGEV